MFNLFFSSDAQQMRFPILIFHASADNRAPECPLETAALFMGSHQISKHSEQHPDWLPASC